MSFSSEVAMNMEERPVCPVCQEPLVGDAMRRETFTEEVNMPDERFCVNGHRLMSLLGGGFAPYPEAD